MIRCILGDIIAARKLKISKISEDLGISRSTLTALRDNNGNGVFFSTIDKLCRYLDISPADLIEYAPVMIDVLHVDICQGYATKENMFYQVALYISAPKDGGKIRFCRLALYMNLDDVRQNENNWLDIRVSLLPEKPVEECNEVIANEDYPEQNQLIKYAFGMLQPQFIRDLEGDIKTLIIQRFLDGKEPRFVRFFWSDDILGRKG